ncbi:GLUG motif-containing protein, partial [Geotoga petraea]
SFSSGVVQGSKSVGGLIGRNNGSVSNVFSNADLSGIEIEKNGELVFEGENIGGIVGYNSNNISNSYFVGSINGVKNTGGIAGIDFGNIVSSYYVNSISGLTNKNGEGKYVSELKLKSTFVGWDFDNIWNISEGESFPFLRSFEDIILTDEFSVSGFVRDFEGRAIDNILIEIYSVQKNDDGNFVPDLTNKITEVFSNSEGYWSIDKLSGRIAVVPKNNEGTYFYPNFVVTNSSSNMSFKYLEFEGGEGTETSPYLISNEKQLDYMRY